MHSIAFPNVSDQIIMMPALTQAPRAFTAVRRKLMTLSVNVVAKGCPIFDGNACGVLASNTFATIGKGIVALRVVSSKTLGVFQRGHVSRV